MQCGKNLGTVKASMKSSRPVTAALAALLVLLPVFGGAAASSGPDIVVSSSRIAQGDSAFVLIRTRGGTEPRALWMGKPLYLVSDREKKNWYGFLGVDLTAEPGAAPLSVEIEPGGERRRLEMSILKKDRGVRVLTLPKKMVELDAETLERARRESGIMNKVLGSPPVAPLWRGFFDRPLEGEVVGAFGTRSVINGEARSPHSGVDLRAAAGTPVKSIQKGRVALLADHFFSGKSVVIDHGGAIQSMYFHLEKTMVGEGEEVERGQVIGLVGSTGRSTGPHLHFGMRVNGARVDPMQFIALSEQTVQP